MSREPSHEQAAVEMRSFQAEPLENYPGYRAPWRVRCLACDDEVTSNLNYARRFGRPHKGCAANPRRTRKLTHEQAVAEMRSLQAEPLEPYPGIHAPLKCRCMLCGRIITPDLGHTRRYGRPCAGCPANPRKTRKLAEDVVRAVMRAAGLVPLEPYTDSKTPWLSRCLSCNNVVTPTYNKVQQKNHGCRHCGIARRALAKMRDLEAMGAAYRALGGIPEGTYPGVDEPWPGRCAKCTRRVVRSWKKIEKSGYFCTYCSGKRVIPEEAVAAMLAAGCTPLEPYTTSGPPGGRSATAATVSSRRPTGRSRPGRHRAPTARTGASTPPRRGRSCSTPASFRRSPTRTRSPSGQACAAGAPRTWPRSTTPS